MFGLNKISTGFETFTEKLVTQMLDITRSQAVARIADRTSKYCKGHVT